MVSQLYWGEASGVAEEEEDAGIRSATSHDVNVGKRRAAGAGQASDQADQAAGRGSTQRTLAAVLTDVQRSGPAVDSAGAVAEGFALDGAVYGAQRADVL